ncbi:DUF4349 domain-containing protein [Halobacillus shinanisalinarum]|uniref:DUF4349 domain-containing protein n=1 Tax=Halobacillus shinanisalinarum TaxID=2932258 RepID=A0ABY4H5C0_9BACI|nr:DUF4349 domain-containing protein [Halobacillus shinanisalinarum]UOQ95295.1 DUF4349 domain-containing protein [Halobacillus shinanisalinarum]
MRKWLVVIVIISFCALATSCSDDSKSSESLADKTTLTTEDGSGGEESKFATPSNELENIQQDDVSKEGSTQAETDEINQSDRKVIYTANLRIEVKDYQQSIDEIQAQVSERGGYIVGSNRSGDSGEGSVNGHVTARIPQGEFREFMQLVEQGSSKVLESSISGQDVTEEYVDLESRLKSKRVVEKRLLSFMEQADKTEDLLKISNDLATVQGKIEEIQGRMNYLQNKADLATVTVHIQENNVRISGMNDEELNTWDQAKQQFLKSINFLISIFSGLVVFFVGNIPVLLPLAIIGVIVFLMIRKKRNKRSQEGL